MKDHIESKIRKSWIKKVKEFQSLSKTEQDHWCSHCGCTGGCNLCTDISNISENEIYDDTNEMLN